MPSNLSIVGEPRRRRIPPLRNGVYILPNLITTGGLVAGFYSLICTHNGLMVLIANVYIAASAEARFTSEVNPTTASGTPNTAEVNLSVASSDPR